MVQHFVSSPARRPTLKIIYRSFVLFFCFARLFNLVDTKLKTTQKMDRNHDGVVTIDEFLDCCRCDQAITNSMLVFDSTIWPSGSDLDGNRRKIHPAQDEQRVPQNDPHQPPDSNHSAKSNVQSTTAKQSGNGSTKSKSYDNQSHKNLSSSFGANPRANGPPHQQQQQFHHPNQPSTVFGNKTKNNVGHKASQTKRIQLSTAAKRCKSINRSQAVDNNNSKAINPDDICKADGADGQRADVDDDKCVSSRQRQNSISNRSESPTLVTVKTWYTESVALPSPHDVIFWYWMFFMLPKSKALYLDFDDSSFFIIRT